MNINKIYNVIVIINYGTGYISIILYYYIYYILYIYVVYCKYMISSSQHRTRDSLHRTRDSLH